MREYPTPYKQCSRELRRRLDAANEAEDAARAFRSRANSAAREAADAARDAVLKMPEAQAAFLRERETSRALAEAVERAQFEESNAVMEKFGLKLGDRLEGFKRSDYGYHATPGKVFGFLELRQRETEMPENVRWDLPQVGQLFVRLATKAGTPGKAIARFTVDNGTPNWKKTEGR